MNHLSLFVDPIKMVLKGEYNKKYYEAQGQVNLNRLVRFAAPVIGVPQVQDEVPIHQKFSKRIIPQPYARKTKRWNNLRLLNKFFAIEFKDFC